MRGGFHCERHDIFFDIHDLTSSCIIVIDGSVYLLRICPLVEAKVEIDRVSTRYLRPGSTPQAHVLKPRDAVQKPVCSCSPSLAAFCSLSTLFVHGRTCGYKQFRLYTAR